jgi:hypothetical protein
MKKCIISLIIASLSLSSSVLTFQAAAQDKRFSVATSTDGPRYEIVVSPDEYSTCYKFDKETGDTWRISYDKVTKIDKDLAFRDETHPDMINYQLIVADSSYLLLLNLNTGTTWLYINQIYPSYDRFKELDMGL